LPIPGQNPLLDASISEIPRVQADL